MSRRSSLGSGVAPATLSQIPGQPTFRHAATNAVAVIPLLSSGNASSGGHLDEQGNPETYSTASFQTLFQSLARYGKPTNGQEANEDGDAAANANRGGSSIDDDKEDDNDTANAAAGNDVLLVVPNANLTRPGEWRYDDTPLKNFHWEHGCQRIRFFDGRPDRSRAAHDRLMNHGLTRNWIDICPHRRTAAVIGVLNIRDCPDLETLKRAEEEWQYWADRYSTPPYEVTAHGRDFERDAVIQRLFVYDSAHDSNMIDLEKADLVASLGSSLVPFPPTDDDQIALLDGHMNVVVDGIAVSIFEELEKRIRESDAVTGSHGQPLTPAAATKRFFSKATSSMSTNSDNDNSGPKAPSNASLVAIASVVSPESKLASVTPTKKSNASHSKQHKNVGAPGPKGACTEAQLLTPLDDVWDLSELSPKDAQGFLRREVGRREKFAGDMALLAGSPIDAYERYTKAAELCKNSTPDPLWYASALEGCAAAHVAMADVGGFNVDDYLDSSFQLPEEIMACAIQSAGEGKSRQTSINKQTMPNVVAALCDEALGIFSRHAQLAPAYAELLLKMSWYTAELEDLHLKCQWGLGEECYGGDASGGKPRRWQRSSITRMNFLDMSTKNGDDVISQNTFRRCQNLSSLMHRAISNGALDPVSRADAALCCASICLRGLRPTDHPATVGRSQSRVQFKRKAAFFVTAAAEAISEVDVDESDRREEILWSQASALYAKMGNQSHSSRYGWATLRATALHAQTLLSSRAHSENSAVSLLSLLGEIQPNPKSSGSKVADFLGKFNSVPVQDGRLGSTPKTNGDDYDDSVSYTAESVVTAARSYVRNQAQDALQNARSKGGTFFNQNSKETSSLLVAAQSRWVDDKPIKTILLPLADSSDVSYSIVALKSVWSGVKLEECVIAQRKLISQLYALRKELPASSAGSAGMNEANHHNPISIISATIVSSKSHAELKRAKKKKKAAENADQGAMATFFNPYANSNKDKAENATVMIAEGEERYVAIRFSNRLCVPLDVPRSQLVFSTDDDDRTKAPAMSFVVPALAKDFLIQFPFMLLPKSQGQSATQNGSEILEIKGISISCLGRKMELGFGKSEAAAASVSNIPKTTSLFPRRKFEEEKSATVNEVSAPRLDVVPPQPNLAVSFALSNTRIDEDTVIPVPISDGESFTLPTLVLKNENRTKTCGLVEMLQITAQDMPVSGSKLLHEIGESTDDGTAAQGGSNDDANSPLEVSATTKNLSLDSLNGLGEGGRSTVSVLIKAASNLGAYTNGCIMRLRLKYRTKSYSDTFDIWRQCDIKLRVIRIKGARISSLTFRPDLSWESEYAMMCNQLAVDLTSASNANHVAPIANGDRTIHAHPRASSSANVGAQVGGGEVVVLVSIANETNSPIVLTRPDDQDFGFSHLKMNSIRISSGVSSKVPIVIPRLKRDDKVSEKLISMTKLQWKSETDDDAESVTEVHTSGATVASNKRVRYGTTEIPAKCLEAVLSENPFALGRLCESPFHIDMEFGGTKNEDRSKSVVTTVGEPVSVAALVEMAEWFSKEYSDEVELMIRFCCADKNNNAVASKTGNGHYHYHLGDGAGHDSFAWCGKSCAKIDESVRTAKDESSRYDASILYLVEGRFVISACIEVANKKTGSREVWWSAQALYVQVGASETQDPAAEVEVTSGTATVSPATTASAEGSKGGNSSGESKAISDTNHSLNSSQSGWFTLDG